MRTALRRLFALILRAFFRKVEVVGLENIPNGGVIFAVNHPNGLIDPLFLLTFLPRPVSFMAKQPLFRMPVISFFVRQLDSIPVYRKQDQNDPAKNAETFGAARRILAAGGSIAIFPEGTTHSDSRLKPLKTGAARIALAANCNADADVAIVPTGIYYTAKTTFRSCALVSFGRPFSAGKCRLDENGEPDREAVRALTAQIEDALRTVTVQADSHAALAIVRAAEDIFSSAAPAELAEELELQRRLVDGYGRARELMPERVAHLEAHVVSFAAELDAKRLAAHELDTTRRPLQSIAQLSRDALVLVLLLAPATLGSLMHLVPYFVVDFLARMFSRGEEEMVGTIKVIAGALLYLATWLALLGLTAHYFRWRVAAAFLVALPFIALATLWFWETMDVASGRLRALLQLAFRRYSYRRLLAQRRAIREEIAAIAQELERSAATE